MPDLFVGHLSCLPLDITFISWIGSSGRENSTALIKISLTSKPPSICRIIFSRQRSCSLFAGACLPSRNLHYGLIEPASRKKKRLEGSVEAWHSRPVNRLNSTFNLLRRMTVSLNATPITLGTPRLLLLRRGERFDLTTPFHRSNNRRGTPMISSDPGEETRNSFIGVVLERPDLSRRLMDSDSILFDSYPSESRRVNDPGRFLNILLRKISVR